MTSRRASRWPRAAVSLLATAGLVLAATTVAFAQDPEEPPEDTGVECDAEAFVEEGEAIYLALAGDTVECVASGLDPEVEADWLVEVFDFEEGVDDPVASVGEDGLLPEEDGTLTFEFVLPDDILLGAFAGLVSQGEVGDETYLEEFFGLIIGFFEGPMVCDPDPVRQGEDVECVAEEMAPGDFEWEVHFLAVGQLLDLTIEDPDEFDEEAFEEAFVAPDLADAGTADDEGVGAFEFGVPTEDEIDAYLAVAVQDAFVAAYVGEVEPAVPPVEEPVEEEPTPVPVERPERVETGGGGTAPSDGQPRWPLLLVALALASAVVLRRRSRDGRAVT